jgi:hypothetical protein
MNCVFPQQKTTVTFQTVLVSDGHKSYGVVTYKRNAIKWIYRQNTPIIIGFARGDGYRNMQFLSNTRTAFNGLDREKGNTG